MLADFVYVKIKNEGGDSSMQMNMLCDECKEVRLHYVTSEEKKFLCKCSTCKTETFLDKRKKDEARPQTPLSIFC